MQRLLIAICFFLTSISNITAQLTLQILDVETCNNTVDVPIIVQENISLTSLQYTLQWDGSGLTFNSITTPLNPTPVYGPNGGSPLNDTITVVWSGSDLAGQAFNAGDTIFTLNFTITGAAGSSYPVQFYNGNNNNYPAPPFATGPNFIPISPINTIDGSATVLSNVPTLIGCSMNIPASTDAGICEAAVSWTIPTVEDCDNNSSAPVESNGYMPGDIFQVGTTTITYTVTDADGNSDSCSFDIIVTDDEDPTISCPTSDIIISVPMGTTSMVVNDPQLIPTTDDNCPGETVSFSMVNGANMASGPGDANGQEFFLGTTEVTYTVTDASNNTAVCVFNVILQESATPPITLQIGTVDAECCSGTVDVPIIILEDANLTSLQFTMFWDGSGLTYNSIASVFDPLVLGPNSGGPLVDTLTVVWSSSDINGQAVTAGDALFTLTFDMSSCTVGESFPVSFYNGSNSNYPQPFASGPNFTPIGVNVIDGVVNVVDTTPPTITCPGNVTVECDESTGTGNTGMATATDVCDPNPSVAFSDVSVLDQCNNTGTITRTWTTTDAQNNTMTCVQTITVVDTTDPTFTAPGTVTINCDDDPTDLTLTGDVTNEDDNCDTSLDATFTDDPSGLTGCNGTGTLIRTWTLTDDCGNSVSHDQTINVVDNTDPTFSAPATATINCEDDPTDLTLTGDVTDEDDNCDTSLDATFTDDPSGLTGCNGTGTLIRTWTLTDDCGNSVSHDQTINVVDNTDPTFTVPADITIDCDEDPLDLTLTGDVTDEDDNCSIGLQATFVDTPSGTSSCGGPSQIIRTWTLTDDCGNSISLDQIITLEDVTVPPPTFTPPPAVTINCEDDPTDLTITGDVTDESSSCAANVEATYMDDLSGLTGCNGTGDIIRTWTLDDGCSGAIVSHIQIITVVDNTAPTFTAPATVTLNCEDDVTDLSLAGDVTDEDDNCSINLEADYTDDTSGLNGCNGTGQIVRTWTLTDDCGNTTTHNQIITIIDSTAPTFTAPPAVTLNCEDDVTDLSLTGDVTDEDDNCSINLEADYIDDTSGLTGCNGTGEIIRTWTLSDDCGLLVFHDQVITIVDNTPPSFTAPSSITIDCNEDPLDLTLTGDVTDEDDNCSTGLQATFTDVPSGTSICGGPSQIIRTWTLTDDCGNSISIDQIINLSDTPPPTFTVPPAVMINCEDDPTDLTLTGDVMDENSSCAMNVEATYADSLDLTGCNGTGQIIRTWTLDDGCSIVVEAIQIITVVDNTAPTFTSPGAITINCEDDATDLSLTGDVTDEDDNCDTSLDATYMDDTSGLMGCNGTGQIIRTWTLTDDCGNTVSHDQTITVIDNTAPTFTAPASVTINCEDDVTDLSITGDVTNVADNCDTSLIAIYTDDTSGLTGCNGTGEIIRTWTVTDDCDNATSQEQTIEVVDNTDPTFTVPPDITIECTQDSSDLALTGDVTDEDDNCSMGLQATFTDVPSGTSACGGPDQIIRTWTLTDDCGNSVSIDQIIMLSDGPPPTFDPPVAVTINCEDDPTDLSLTGDVTNEDSSCAPNVEATYTDDLSGLTDCNGTGQIIRTWTLDDGCSGSVSHDQIITVVDNEAPTFTAPAAVTINCEDDVTDLSLTGDVTDEDDNCDTSLDATYTDDNSGLTGCNGTGQIIRTWTLTDDCGNTQSHDQTITVIDNTDPTFTVPSDITIICTENPLDLTLTGDVTDEDDNCSTGLQATFTDAPSGTSGCGGPSQIIRTWTLVDDCGNTISIDQTITLIDDVPPPFPVPPAVTINCEDDPTDLSLTGDVIGESSNCNPNVEAVYVDDLSGLTGCNGTGIIVRTWILDDGCSTVVTENQIITVVDNEAPTFTAPGSVTVNCEDNVTDLSLTGDVADESDNCSTGLQATYVDDNSGLTGCNGTGQIIRTWTLTDDCGNTTSANQTISVVDDTPPTFTAPPTITINCSNYPIDLLITGDVTDESDNCSTNLQAAFTDVESGSTGCGSPSLIIRTWTLTDDCGNTTNLDQVIALTDGSSGFPPLPPVTINCEDDPTDLTLTGDVTGEFSTCNPNVDATYTDDYSGLSGCNGTGVIVRTWTLDDGCSSIVSIPQIITVVDNEAPTFTVPPAVTISCEDVMSVALTGDVTDELDNCSINLEATYIDDNSGLTECNGTGQIVRTWTLTDDCGNTVTQDQIITVIDITPPLAICQNVNIQLDENGQAVVTIAQVDGASSDNCQNGGSLDLSLNQTEFNCNNIGVNVLTLTVLDECGNESKCFPMVTVLDLLSPEINCPGDITVNNDPGICGAAGVWEAATATDNCSSPFLSSSHDVNSIFPVGTTIVTHTASDDSGNIATCTYTVTVLDTEAPVLNCDPGQLQLNPIGDCKVIVNWNPITATDNCTDLVNLTSTHSPGDTFMFGMTTPVVYVATDDAGNMVSCEFDIMPLDTLPVMFTNCPGDTTINAGLNNCTSDFTWAPPTVVENCTGLMISCDPAPGFSFPIGETVVNCFATDTSGDTLGTCSFIVEVLAPLDAIDISSSPSATLCEGEQLMLSTNPLLGTYLWTGPNSVSSMEETLSIDTVVQASEGTYTVVVTLNGGCTVTESIEIAVNQTPSISTDSNSPICDGILVLNATPGPSSPVVSTWNWSGPCGFTSMDQNINIPDLADDCGGNYTVTATTADGCSTSETAQVQTVSLDAPNLALGCDSVICISESCLLLGTAFSPTPEEYHWAASANAGLPMETNQNGLEITPLATGEFTYQYWVDVSGCVTDTASINLTVVDRPEVNDDQFVVDYETPLENFIVTDNDVIFQQLALDLSVVALPSNGSLMYTPDGSFTYTPNDGFIGTDFFLYQICYSCDENQCDTGRVELRVIFEGDCEVPNIITPNGDGVNDALEVVCLNTSEFPNSELLVLNQWGDRVYFASPYLNDWEGTLHGKDGKNLPDATYYFIFKESPSSPAKKGYIMIYR